MVEYITGMLNLCKDINDLLFVGKEVKISAGFNFQQIQYFYLMTYDEYLN